ncbi:hypothetical protein [Lacinutrix sp. MEBiC02404]
MKKFIVKSSLFILPLVLCFLFIEIENRTNNTFYTKSKYIKDNKNSIEVLILGSSQTWRAINPEYLTMDVAPLAHGGSALNIDYLLFKKYVDNFPNLKVVILETSYHTFEEFRNTSWNKNHLFHIYYDVNNYEGAAPWSENLLLTANPKAYIKKIWTRSIFPEFGEYNNYGFITSTKKTLDKSGYPASELKSRHIKESLDNYKIETKLLANMVTTCEEKGLDLILFSPPKYSTYNKNYTSTKLERRNLVFEKYKKLDRVYILNYETTYEDEKDMFYNEDHLNIYGAKKLTKSLNIELEKLMKSLKK